MARNFKPPYTPETGFLVRLAAAGNPDMRQERRIAGRPRWEEAPKIVDAQAMVQEYIEHNRLGGGNWTGGELYSATGFVGRFSYNGRLWDKDRQEIPIEGQLTAAQVDAADPRRQPGYHGSPAQRLEFFELGAPIYLGELAKLAYRYQYLQDPQAARRVLERHLPVAVIPAIEHVLESMGDVPDLFIRLVESGLGDALHREEAVRWVKIARENLDSGHLDDARRGAVLALAFSRYEDAVLLGLGDPFRRDVPVVRQRLQEAWETLLSLANQG